MRALTASCHAARVLLCVCIGLLLGMSLITRQLLPLLRSLVLLQVCDAIELSRKTLSKIQQNLGWAFCYNLVGIPLAAGALLPKYGLALTPSISGALMGFSSLAVMANSLVLQWEVQGLRNGLVTAQQHHAARASVSAVSKTNGWKAGVGGQGTGKGRAGVVGVAVATGMDAV